jgi:kinesin family protein 1
LKEGCAINKSLTVLGNCISILADKAGGKAKGTVVPYRDSNLTRILQNALGGNTKTIMICAISPALLNHEESLSTLRYADRAKKIMNKAVVNESTQDKMIRELRAQNDRLKKILMDAAKNGTGIINLNDLGLGDASDIVN